MPEGWMAGDKFTPPIIDFTVKQGGCCDPPTLSEPIEPPQTVNAPPVGPPIPQEKPQTPQD